MHFLERSLHSFSLSPPRRGGLIALFINNALFQFAAGMVSMFGVLFIFSLGVDFFQGLLYLLLFFGFQRLVVFLAIPVIGQLVSKIGYRWTMLIGLSAFVGKISFLSIATNEALWLLLPSIILGGIAIPSYYLSYHGLFLDDDDDARIGEQTGAIETLGRLSVAASPFVAGLLVDNFGFSVMFSISVFLMFFSVFPLMTMEHHLHQGKFSGANAFKFIKKEKKVTQSMFWWSVTVIIQAIFWPVYLLKVVGNYTAVGVVTSLVLLVSSISLHFIGKQYDKRAFKKVFVGSSIIVSATWIGRFLSLTPFGAVLSDGINRLFSPPWWMKIRRLELLAGERYDSVVFGAAHEYLVTFGAIAGLLTGSLLLFISGGVWGLLIIPTVLGTLLTTKILKDS